MGSVELLTREGEIEIAKRIEDGLKHMIQAISACPTTIAEILRAGRQGRAGGDAHRRGGRRPAWIPNAEEIVGEEVTDEDDGGGLEAEERTRTAAAVPAPTCCSSSRPRWCASPRSGALYTKMMKVLGEKGYRAARRTKDLQEEISARADGDPLHREAGRAPVRRPAQAGGAKCAPTSARSWSCASRRPACRARTSSRSSPATRRTSSGCGREVAGAQALQRSARALRARDHGAAAAC